MRFVWSCFVMLVKTVALLGLLIGVWVYSGVYHAKEYRREADSVIQIRVRRECLRPEYVQDLLAAREYDVTTREMDLITDKMDLMNRKATDLLNQAEHVEAMRSEFTQGKVRPTMGGIGGPAPTKTSR